MANPKVKKKQSGALQRQQAIEAARPKQAIPDPLGPESVRKLALRVGLPVVGLWVLAALVRTWWMLAVAGVLTIALAALVFYVLRYAKRAQNVAQIMQGADTKEARKEAIDKLEAGFKKDDATAALAKANLEIQDDPRKALATLESINLTKTQPLIADQARAQRAMIHLLFGETDQARALADKVDLTKHKERGRAELAAIVAEAWARSGQAKRAAELLGTFDPNDAAYAEIKPALLRSRAFAYAGTSNMKAMKQTLRSLAAINAQYLAGFVTKKKNPMGVNPRGVHPLLEKEAIEMLMKAGAGGPRKMEYRRR